MPALDDDEDVRARRADARVRREPTSRPSTPPSPPSSSAAAQPRLRRRVRLVLIALVVVASRRRSSSGGCRAEPPEPRARRSPHRRSPHGDRLRERLHRAQVADLDRLARLRRLLLRPLPRRARRRAVHRAARRPVPPADGGAAHGDRPDGDLPPRPEQRAAAGNLGRDRRRRRSPRRSSGCGTTTASLERYKYIFGVTRDLPALPAARARDRGDDQRRAALGPRRRAPVPAGRAREDRAHRLPRRVPPREARGARAGAAEGLGAAARDLGRRDARPLRDERPRQRAPLLRDLPRDALRRDGAALVRRRRARALPRRRVRVVARGRRTCTSG